MSDLRVFALELSEAKKQNLTNRANVLHGVLRIWTKTDQSTLPPTLPPTLSLRSFAGFIRPLGSTESDFKKARSMAQKCVSDTQQSKDRKKLA